MRRNDLIIGMFFLLFTLFLFRTYIINPRLVPLPFNLLVSYYSPWKYEEDMGYGIHIGNKPLGFDNLRLFYPFRKFTTEQLSKGRIPLWNPYVFTGNVHHGTFQSAIFYPFNVLYRLLPQADAWSILIMIQPILAGWFTYLFLRSLKLSRGAGFVGSMGFAFSGWMIAHWQEVLVIVQSILWLPLSLYAINKSRGFLLLIFSLSMSILGGFPQMVVYHVATVVVWSIYRKKFVSTIVSIVAALGITAIQWIPAFEAYLLAPRAKVDSSFIFQMFLSPLWHLITLLVPDFWGNPGTYNYFAPLRYLQERTIAVGLPIFILSILALFYGSGKLRFWKWFTLLTLSLGFALPTSWIWYISKIPLLSAAQPARIFILSTFGLCVLAAYGFDEIGRVRLSKRPFVVIASVFVLLWMIVGVAAVIATRIPGLLLSCPSQRAMPWYCQYLQNDETVRQITSYASVSSRNLAISTVLFVTTVLSFFYFRLNRRIFFISVTGLMILWVSYYANKLLYFSDRANEYPAIPVITRLKELAGIDRVWSYGDAHIIRNIPSEFGLYSPEGYEALFSHRYNMLLNTIRTRGALSSDIARTDATLSETGQFEIMPSHPWRQRLLSLLGVKYILEYKGNSNPDRPASERFPSKVYSISWEDDTWRIWEYKKVLPRAFFVTHYIVENDDQKIIDALYSPSVDLRKTVVLEETPPGFAGNVADDATVSITNYEPEKVELSVEAQRDGLVFLSDTYDPGWKAMVDGKETKIFRANFTFRAVVVPRGSHQILFTYDPLSFRIGLWTSIVSVIIVCIVIIRKHEA